MTTQRINFLKGELPSDQAQEWMTKKDWDNFYEDVEELKRTGEYLKPDYIDICYNENSFDAFKIPLLSEGKNYFSNYGFLIPEGCYNENIKKKH